MISYRIVPLQVRIIFIIILVCLISTGQGGFCEKYGPNTKSGSSKDTKPDAPYNLSATIVSTTQINLSWTDNSKVESGYYIERSTDGTNWQLITTTTANITSYSDTGLTDGTHYYYRICAYNASGKSNYANEASATIPDTTPPSSPTNLTAYPFSQSKINLTWSASTDNVGVIGYKVYRDDTQVITTSNTSCTDTSLSPLTTYTYTVAAYDDANNLSALSSPASATTYAIDNTVPTSPTNLIAVAISSSKINLTWSASTDNVGVIGYKVYRDDTQVITTSNTSCTDTWLLASTTYTYTVAAYDDADNLSALSSPASATTAAPIVDDYVWVANYGSNNVTRIKKSDSTTTAIAAGTNPIGVSVDAIYVWVTNQPSNNVTRIKKSDLTTTTIDEETGPGGVGVDDSYVWGANHGSHNVTRIKKSDLTTTTIGVGTGPAGVAVDDSYVWVTNQHSNNVTRIKKSDLTTTTIAVGVSPLGIAVDDTYVWVVNVDDNTITRIKKSDSTTTAIAVGTNPYAIAVDGTYAWVTNTGSGTVTRIKKSDLTKTPIAAGTNPVGVSVDDTYVWVANWGSANVTRIQKLDLSTTNITVGTNPYSMGDMTGYAYNNIPP